MEPRQKGWAECIKAHALAHYNEDGWDMIVECYGDEEFEEAFNERIETGQPCANYDEALAEVHFRAKLWDDKRKDIQGTVW